MVFFSVFKGRDAELLLEQVLKVGLAGKEEKVGNFRKGAVGIG